MTAPEGVAARLAELAALHAAATPGPWGTPVAPTWIHRAEALGHVGTTEHAEDAALIVAAVNALPDLIAAVRAVADLADELEDWRANAIRYAENGRPTSVEVAQAKTRALAYQRAIAGIRAALSALSGRDDHAEEAGR